MSRKRRIDLNEIVGNTFNGLLIKAYVGDKEYKKSSGVVQKVPMYECECIECGRTYVKNGQQIENNGCRSCSARKKMLEINRLARLARTMK